MFKFFQRNKNKDTTKTEIIQNDKDSANLKSSEPIVSQLDSNTINTTESLHSSVTHNINETIKDTNSISKKPSFFNRLYNGLAKTRKQILGNINTLFTGKVNIDDELWEDLESHLLLADVGIEVTNEILDELTKEIKTKQANDIESLKTALRAKLTSILQPCESHLEITAQSPYVLLMVGVNGAGKTTTIGKLTNQFQDQGHSVILAAGDTFRAAAVEQLKAWGERNNVQVISQKTGSDSASVIFDAYQSAKAKNIDILIADTAGRLHTQSNLMQELAKIKRVLNKQSEYAPHEVMLVLDASMGQNALEQAKQFQKMVNVSGIALTKLDGTAKGGIIFAIAKKLNLPIRYIGVGEGINDLQPFNAKDFVNALID